MVIELSMRALARPTTWTILAVGFIAGCGKKEEAAPPPPEVKVVQAVERDVPISKEWVGQTIGALDIEIRARVTGWLQGMHFQEGTEIKEGALLYTIDQSELLQQVAEAKGRLAQARTLMNQANSDVERYRPLAEAGAVSKRDLDRALAEYGSRQGEVDAAQAALNVAEINLGYATIKAPISGLIGISSARVGDFVGRPPNPVILNTISKIDSIHVRFSITEQEYLDLARRFQERNTKAGRAKKTEFRMVLADGSVFPSPGIVIFAQRQIDAATGTLLLEASFPNPGKVLRPGQFARLRAVFEERKGAVVVPIRAVTELQGQSVVYAVGSDGKAQFRRVQIGPKVGNVQVVEQGVTAGEKIIVEGIQRVRPDMPVAAEVIPFPADSSAAPAPAGGEAK
jgi:membrane fusion protein (multidrug efflux system)